MQPIADLWGEIAIGRNEAIIHDFGANFHSFEPKTMRKVILNTLVFVAGFTTVFALLGASASYLGQYLVLYKKTINIVGGILVIILGLHLLGIFRIGWLGYEKRFNVKGKPLGILGSYLIGAAFAFGWTPCIGPILSAILIIAANQDTVRDGVFLLIVYSAGLGIPFLIKIGRAHV